LASFSTTLSGGNFHWAIERVRTAVSVPVARLIWGYLFGCAGIEVAD
jgi:hypothetical protein